MNSAEELFTTLGNLRQTNTSGDKVEEQFLNYCRDVLGAVERVHFDFKEKSERTNPHLGGSDKKNLARAVSGFANSAGGVLIWGIEDETNAPKPICQVERFLTLMLELAPRSTEPIPEGIDGFVIRCSDTSSDGYAVLYVPESVLPPHRVTLKVANVSGRYYVRSGSAFAEATHAQLEDMFGRRPRPDIHFEYRIHARHISPTTTEVRVLVVVGIANRGRGVARSPFMVLEVPPPYSLCRWGIDGNGRFGLPELPVSSDLRERWFGAGTEPIIHSGTTLDVAVVRINVHPPRVPDDLIIDYRIAAEGQMAVEGRGCIEGRKLLEQATAALSESESK